MIDENTLVDEPIEPVDPVERWYAGDDTGRRPDY